MRREFGRLRRASSQRNTVIVIFAVAVLLASTPFLPRILARFGVGIDKGKEAVGIARDALGVMTVLGEDPNDEKLIEGIQDRNMPGREMGIEFLGEDGHGQALPVLETIVRDTSERATDRVAALNAIYKIAAHKGLQLAKEFENDSELADTAHRILHASDESEEEPSRVRKLFSFFN